jgi:hypothetical protein
MTPTQERNQLIQDVIQRDHRIRELEAALTWISLGPGYYETKEEAVLEMMRVSAAAIAG